MKFFYHVLFDIIAEILLKVALNTITPNLDIIAMLHIKINGKL